MILVHITYLMGLSLRSVMEIAQNEDPCYLQDGVAPQCAVSGFDVGLGDQYGSAYIPPDVFPKGFVESHLSGNYGWIFKINKKEDGFIDPK